MSSEKRPSRYPVKIIMKHRGKGGITRPAPGIHFCPKNEQGIIGAYPEGSQLKYWIFNGKRVRENPYKFFIGTKDIEIIAVFGQKKPQTSLEGAKDIIEKDISVSSGIRVKHEKEDSRRKPKQHLIH